MYKTTIKALIVFSLLLLFSSAHAVKSVAIENDQLDKTPFNQLLRSYVFDTYKDENGVHVESVLSALGALSGYALQQGIREKLISKGGMAEEKLFTIIEAKNGEKFYFGSIFDQPLYDTRQGKISVWALSAGAAQKAGLQKLPDFNIFAKRNANLIGTPEYGTLSVPNKHQPKHHPIKSVIKHWQLTKKLLEAKGSDPLTWSWEIAMVAQEVIILSKGILPPEVALQLVMEPAISMSKISPSKISTNE